MPHRDPETGQFVGSAESHGFFGDADDILRMNTSVEYGTDDANGSDIASRVLTYQKDYRIVGAVLRAQLVPNSPLNRGTNAFSDGDQGTTVGYQWTTTGNYVTPPAPADGGKIPDGVYHSESIRGATGQTVSDGTGAGGGYDGVATEHVHTMPAPELTNGDLTPDAGTTSALRLRLVDSPVVGDNTQAMRAASHLDVYVAERHED